MIGRDCMWLSLFICIFLASSAVYAGDYGRSSSSRGMEEHKARQDADLKLIKEFSKDLPASLKSQAVKAFYAQKSKRQEIDRDHPGRNFQNYLESSKRVKAIFDKSSLEDSQKSGLFLAYEDAKKFTLKSDEQTEAILEKVLRDQSIVDSKQRIILLKKTIIE